MRRVRGSRRSFGIWHYEWRKLFDGALPILFCVLLLTADARGAYRALVLPSTFEENLTSAYMSVLEGEVTEEKRRYIREEQEKIDRIRARSCEMANGYWEGTVDHETYTAYITALNDATERAAVVEQLQRRIERIDMLAEKECSAHLVNETGWSRIFALGADHTLAALLILLFSGICAYERRYGFSAILQSTKNGRLRTACAKLGITLLFSALAGAASFAYRVALVAASAGLPCAHAPAASIEGYERFGGSLLQLLLLGGLLRIVGAVVLGLFCFSLSALFERTLPVMAITSLAAFGALLLRVFGVTAPNALMLNGLLDGISPILSAQGALAAILWGGTAVLLAVLSFCKMKGA